MDSVLNRNNFPLLDKIEDNLYKNIKILTIFGCNGKEVIFVTNEDNVYGYGRNRFGGLGLGHFEENIGKPQLNPFLSGKQVANIFCGFEHWTALTSSGECYTWGKNDFGQLGINSLEPTATPQFLEELSNKRVVQISCGAAHTLALTADGKMYSWGSNKTGQLGNGIKGSVLIPTEISFNPKVISISCGKNHCIALTIDGKVYVWGLNYYGQLGRESICGPFTPFPKKLWDLTSIVFRKVICGPNFTLLLSSEGVVYAFGDNSCGQIGNGSTQKQVLPIKVREDIKFKDIIANKEEDLSIAISEDDIYYMWGLAQNRRNLTPKVITDSDRLSVFDIYAIYAKTKVTYKTIVINDELKSWERINQKLETNSVNAELVSNCVSPYLIRSLKASMDQLTTDLQTLDNVFDVKNLPILYTTLIDQRVRNSIRLIRVFGNRGCKVIFITNSDKAYAYGLNRDGCLALDTKEERIRKPILSPTLSNKQVVDIASGYEHCIGLTDSGKCYAWGINQFGQLGTGNIENLRSAKLIEELTDVTIIQICCGAYHSMALSSDGDLFAWGHNTFSQLGDRTYNSRTLPTPVMVSEKVVSIASGTNHSVALTVTGRVFIWGNNQYGQLGRSPDEERCNREKPMCNRPILISGLENIIVNKVICGPNHTILLTNDSDVYSFGLNNEGQVGNGTTQNQYVPQKLNRNIKIKDIISHFDNDLTIAVSTDNKCFVWGQVYGQNRVLKPKLVEGTPQTINDIYVKNSCNKVMFQTLVINSLGQIRKSGLNFDKLEELVFEKNFNQYSRDGLNQKISEIIKSLEENNDYPNSSSSEEKNLDNILDTKLIPILSQKLSDENVRKNIKILCVFGKSGSEVIYATNKDLVYGFGSNESGCLGLGCDSRKIGSPTLNGILSNKSLIDIRCGFKHCIGLTESGQCYGWGHNKFGQLGLGNNRLTTTPTIIIGLVNKKVVQICCGAYHSLALTNDGKIYSWGQNKLGQLGNSTYKDMWSPIQITTKHPIISISCGWNHSTGLADIGIVYMWGHNQFGQLGRERQHDYRPEQNQWIANRPLLNHFFKNIQFLKAICGANYTLLLTTDNLVYGFGDNTKGQIGKGSTNAQHIPIRINDEIRFSDVIVHYANDLSIGVSTDNKYYVWGQSNDKMFLTPKLMPESSEVSIFNVYAKYSINKITFKTIVVNENDNQIKNKCLIECKIEGKDQYFGDQNIYFSDESEEEEDINYFNDFKNCVPKEKTNSEESAVCDNISIFSSIRGSNPSNNLQNSLIQSFNNPNNSDLKITAENKVIYCHKTILQIRNQKFWDIMKENMREDQKELKIFAENYESFYAFLQYLYGIEPEINDKIVFELKSMAETFDEKELFEDCIQYIENMEITPNLSNVCSLYERAVTETMTDLEKTCIEFAAKNWKTIVKSDQFLSMNDSLSKRLIITVLKNW